MTMCLITSVAPVRVGSAVRPEPCQPGITQPVHRSLTFVEIAPCREKSGYPSRYKFKTPTTIPAFSPCHLRTSRSGWRKQPTSVPNLPARMDGILRCAHLARSADGIDTGLPERKSYSRSANRPPHSGCKPRMAGRHREPRFTRLSAGAPRILFPSDRTARQFGRDVPLRFRWRCTSRAPTRHRHSHLPIGRLRAEGGRKCAPA